MKRSLIAAGIVLLLILTTCSYVIYRHFNVIFASLHHPKPIPASLQQARIVTGASAFTKSIDLTASGLGLITDIEPGPANSLLLVGRKGALTLDANHSTRNEVSFPTCFGPITATHLGNGSFFCHSDLMSGPKLLDTGGNTLWTYKDGPIGSGADDAAPGELGPAHTPVVAVGMNGGGGVRLLDANGRQLWQQPDGNVWQIAIAPTPTGNVIVHSNAGGELTLRDITGKAIVHCNPGIYLAWFSLTPWAGDPQSDHLLAANKGAFYILALDGAITARLPAPLAASAGASPAHGIPVHFSPGTISYAALLNQAIWNRSVLYIYDSAHNPVYTEVLDQNCGSVQTVTQPDGTQALLVGCNNQLLRYTAAHQ